MEAAAAAPSADSEPAGISAAESVSVSVEISEVAFVVPVEFSEAAFVVPAAEAPEAQEVIRSVTGSASCRNRRADFRFISVLLYRDNLFLGGFPRGKEFSIL